jgi:hypothetical protein
VEQEHTSWWPQPLSGDIPPEPEPEHLRRDDGHALFYPGRVNGIIGESESGKTWLALAAALQAVRHGQRVIIIDFEDTRGGVLGRLRLLGMTDAHLALVDYIGPDEALHPDARNDLEETLLRRGASLVIIDGFNAAMTLLGLEVNSNSDATAFAQQLLKPIAATGAAVVYVDHVAKNKDARGKGGIGAQAKRAMTTGCTLTVDVVEQPARGVVGKLSLKVDKDRPGRVREVSAGSRHVGVAIIDGTGEPLTVKIEAPDLRPAEERGPFRPTGLMEKVSRLLESTGELSRNSIIGDIGGRAEYARKAIDVMEQEGYVARRSGPRNAILYTLVQPFSELGEM